MAGAKILFSNLYPDDRPYIGAMVPLALYTRHCEVNHWSLEAVLLIVLLGLDNIIVLMLLSR